jgi:hypothetical protein
LQIGIKVREQVGSAQRSFPYCRLKHSVLVGARAAAIYRDLDFWFATELHKAAAGIDRILSNGKDWPLWVQVDGRHKLVHKLLMSVVTDARSVDK